MSGVFSGTALAAVLYTACAVYLVVSTSASKFDYANVVSMERHNGIRFDDLPGFTRSVYKPNYALITPESRVWTHYQGWKRSDLAYLISKGSGAHFSMYFAHMQVRSVIRVMCTLSALLSTSRYAVLRPRLFLDDTI